MSILSGNRKKVVALAALAIVWAGLLVWQFLMWEEPVRVPLTNIAGRPAGHAQAQNHDQSLRVHLDLLEAARDQRDMSFAAPRNIFALPDSGGVPRAGVTENVESMGREQSAAAELAQFHYLGFVRMGEGWEKKPELAVLTKNEDLHVVMKGQTVDNHVLVKAINRESVTLLDRDSHVEYTVLLSEEPLTQ